MKRRRQRGNRGKAGHALAAQPVRIIRNPLPRAQAAFFDGASSSPRRGEVYSPTLDTKRELTPYERERLMRRVRWAVGNSGLGARCTWGLSQLIGTLMPIPTTTDNEWNRLAREVILSRSRSRSLFDIGGRFTWNSFQIFADAVRFRDGDFLIVRTVNENGQALFAFYESHQIVSPPDARNGENGWYDGVKTDRHGRAVAYGVRDTRTDKVKVISAKYARLYYNPKGASRVRGESGLAHGINSILDIVETRADIKTGFKIAALFGLTLEKTQSSPSQGFVGFRNVAVPEGGIPDPAPEFGPAPPPPSRLKIEHVTQGGQIADLPEGYKVGTISDNRPGPNFEEFMSQIISDIAWGCGVSPAVLWDISGLTGPAVRYSLNEVERWAKTNLSLKAELCHSMYAYIIAREIEAGTLRPCADPHWWYAVEWIPQRSLSIDSGKESQEARAMIKAGLMSLSTYYQRFEGKYWATEVEQIIRERKEMKARCAAAGLTEEEVFISLFDSMKTEVSPPEGKTE